MTNNPKPPKEDKSLEAILEQVASKTVDSAIGIDSGALDLETGQRWVLDAQAEALAQINNLVKEQMLSIVGEDELNNVHQFRGYSSGIETPNMAIRNEFRAELRAAINERFK